MVKNRKLLKQLQLENLKTNFYITNPNAEILPQIKTLYKQNRDTLGIPFNRIFDEMLDNKNFIVIVTEDNEVVGFCGFHYKPIKHYYEVEHLCIAEKYRHNGLAIALLQYHITERKSNTLVPYIPTIVAYAVDGKPNNLFYDKLCAFYELSPRKTKMLRKYFLSVDRILNYGSRTVTQGAEI